MAKVQPVEIKFKIIVSRSYKFSTNEKSIQEVNDRVIVTIAQVKNGKVQVRRKSENLCEVRLSLSSTEF